MFQRTQMLMNQEGGSPGGGSTPPVVAPAPAQGAPQPVATVSLDQVQGLIDKAVLASRNGIFADIRRGATAKDDNGNGGAPPTAPVAAAPPSGGDGNPPKPPPGFIAAIDVERMIARSNAVIRLASTNQLTDAQVTRMEAALKSANPEDHIGFVNAYLGDFGLLKSAQPATTQPALTIVPPTPPPSGPQQPLISDKGPPAPGNASDWKKELYDNPYIVTKVLKDRIVAEVGSVAEADRIIANAARSKVHGAGGR